MQLQRIKMSISQLSAQLREFDKTFAATRGEYKEIADHLEALKLLAVLPPHRREDVIDSLIGIGA